MLHPEHMSNNVGWGRVRPILYFTPGQRRPKESKFYFELHTRYACKVTILMHQCQLRRRLCSPTSRMDHHPGLFPCSEGKDVPEQLEHSSCGFLSGSVQENLPILLYTFSLVSEGGLSFQFIYA